MLGGFLIAATLNAATIEKVNFADTLNVGGAKLVLNGMGLRTKRKFGLNWRAYVAALYVQEKSTTTAGVLSQKQPKVIELAFLRSLDRETLTEAWTEGLAANCPAPCGGVDRLTEFNKVMRDVKEGSRLRVVFFDDHVRAEMHGREDATGEVLSPEFAVGMLKVFIGEVPPTEILKRGLLGGS